MIVSPTEIIQSLPDSRVDEMLEYAYAEQKHLYKVVLESAAERKRFRPVLLEKMSRKERHPYMRAVTREPGRMALAFELISHWLLGTQTALLTTFLDALKIKHDGSGSVEEFPPDPGVDVVKAAVDSIFEKYPADVVVLYLRIFNFMPDTRWASLVEIIETDPRLAWNP